MTADSKPSAQINATTSVSQQSGGEAAAVKINQAGEVTINALPKPHPPAPQFVRAYLLWASRAEKPRENADPALLKLWDKPFRAHLSGDANSRDLCEIVRAILGRTLEGGYQRLVLLADPGMGRTPALCYHLRLDWAEEGLARLDKPAGDGAPPPSPVIPIYISLAQLESDLSMETLVRDALNAAAPLPEGCARITLDEAQGLLDQYTCLLLLDDLEELLSGRHKGGFQKLSQFIECYSSHQYVIACRTASYRQPLGNLQIIYLDSLTEQEAQDVLGTEIYARMSNTSQELARNRAMLGNWIRYGKTEDMLRSKGHLLQYAVRKQMEDDKDTYAKYDAAPKLISGLLEQLALAMRLEHVHTYTERQFMQIITAYLDDWHETISWRAIARALRTAGELSFDDKTELWSFADRSHEAYFCAAALLHAPAQLNTLMEQIANYWWRDVLEILVGLVPEPQALFFELIDRDVLAAANCISYAEESASRAVEDALIDALIEQMRLENSARRKYIVERIGESNHPRATEALLTVLHREWSSMVILATVKVLQRRIQQAPAQVRKIENKVQQSLAKWDEPVVDLLQSVDPDRPESWQHLNAILRDPLKNSRLRGVAAIALGLLNRPETSHALLDLIQTQEADDMVAWCAVEALTECDPEHVRAHLCRLLQDPEYKEEKWAHHRARAVYLLGRTGGQPETDQQVCEELASKDPNPLVRAYAVEAMARRDLKDARQKVEQVLNTEKETLVLRKAAEALGQIGSLESVALLERYLRLEQARTRWAVRQAIAEIKRRHQV